jgi:hypothetical protein
MTRTTVMLQIRALLDDHPLRYEPGQEKASAKAEEDYNRVVQYRVIRYCVLDMAKDARDGRLVCAAFNEKAREIFSENIAYYDTLVASFRAHDGKTLSCFHFTEKVDYKGLVRDMEALRGWAWSQAELESRKRKREPIDLDGEAAAAAAAAGERPGKRQKVQEEVIEID